MRIDASKKTLESLFFGQTRITVPDYQRNYAWKSEQIDAFMSDLYALANDPTDEHFFGPVVVLDAGNNELSLIDGQQRITTTVIVLCLLRDILNSFEDGVVTIGGNPINLSTQYIAQLLKLSDFVTNRYSANYQIKQIFKDYILADPDSDFRKELKRNGQGMSDHEKSVTRELRASYHRVKASLEKWLLDNAGNEAAMKEQILELLLAMRERFVVLEIKMYSEDDAYILFETLNERGLRLTASDLLKSFTLRKAKEDNSPNIENVLDTWDSTVSKLGDFPFTKFLRHYLLSKQKNKVQAKKIFGLFTEIVDGYGNNGAVKNLKEIEQAAGIYNSLLNASFGDSVIDKAVERLNVFSDTHRVFLLRVMGTDAPIESKRRAVKATEVVAFRWVLTGGNAQILENAYQTAANLIDSNDLTTLDAGTNKLLENLVSDTSVRSSITDNPSKAELRQYVLNRINYAVSNVSLPFNAQQIHVEHLAPQNPHPDSNWFDRVAPRVSDDPNTPTYEDYVSRWGNLSLLEFEINQSIQNGEWDLKLAGQPHNTYQGLNDTNIQITKDVCHVQEWTGTAIDARTAWIADVVVAITGLATVDGQIPSVASFSLTPGA
jgi:uncharacterized protein with ParB-like and HNH nuclease domain